MLKRILGLVLVINLILLSIIPSFALDDTSGFDPKVFLDANKHLTFSELMVNIDNLLTPENKKAVFKYIETSGKSLDQLKNDYDDNWREFITDMYIENGESIIEGIRPANMYELQRKWIKTYNETAVEKKIKSADKMIEESNKFIEDYFDLKDYNICTVLGLGQGQCL
ncbi:hypothetical protein [Inediibacterium massiliense]|uniref:hypothetical protein n=1 Tax=Inediibacterium massiliense TaxID=1658111 RepID=UPI0006B444BE|nr:hypothetical protein [Inediibacterium massiliense]